MGTIQKGDIYFFEICKKFYFLQIIHITTDLSEDYKKAGYCFGYFIVVFEKSFRELPQSMEELDLQTVYKIKTKPRNSLLFISNWNRVPELNINKNVKTKTNYFGNCSVSDSFIPTLSLQFGLPTTGSHNKEGIIISPTAAYFDYIFDRIRDDAEHDHRKRTKIEAKYFEEWIEYVAVEAIIKTEKIIATFESEAGMKGVRKALIKCIAAINKLNNKLNFIYSIEAENLVDTITELSQKHGLSEREAIEIIENNRTW